MIRRFWSWITRRREQPEPVYPYKYTQGDGMTCRRCRTVFGGPSRVCPRCGLIAS